MKNIIMNTEMTKAILDSRKSQTRRAVKKFYDLFLREPKKHPLSFKDMPKDLEFKELQGFGNPCPLFYSKSEDKFYCGESIKYKIGERVWVREPVKVFEVGFDCFHFSYIYLADEKIRYINTPKRFVEHIYRNGNFDVVKSPKWLNKGKGIPNGNIKEMARLFLINIGTRIKRLHNITFEDIFKEGYPNGSIKDFFITTKYKEKITLDNGNELDLITTWWINLWNKTAPKGYKWEDNPYVFVYEFERVNKNGSEL